MLALTSIVAAGDKGLAGSSLSLYAEVEFHRHKELSARLGAVRIIYQHILPQVDGPGIGSLPFASTERKPAASG